MRWLELLVVIEAAGDLVLGLMNCLYFAGLAKGARTQARRVAAVSLSLVNGGFALEATLWLVVDGQLTESTAQNAFELVVRTMLLLAVLLVSLLVWRAQPS